MNPLDWGNKVQELHVSLVKVRVLREKGQLFSLLKNSIVHLTEHSKTSCQNQKTRKNSPEKTKNYTACTYIVTQPLTGEILFSMHIFG